MLQVKPKEASPKWFRIKSTATTSEKFRQVLRFMGDSNKDWVF